MDAFNLAIHESRVSFAMARWSDKFEQRFFLRSDDGHVVFFPSGPLRGYILPKKSYRGIVYSAFKRFALFSLGLAVITTSIGILFSVNFMAMTWMNAVCDVLIYHAIMRRVTRRMCKLPFVISFRYFSRWTNEVRQWQLFFLGVMTTTLMLIGGGLPGSVVIFAIFGSFLACLAGSMIVCRAIQVRAEVRAAE